MNQTAGNPIMQFIEDFRSNRKNIEKYRHPGIYAIKIKGVIVYIGKSKNMLERTVEHLQAILYSNSKYHTNKENKYIFLKEAHKQHYEIQFDVLYYSPRKRESAIENDIGRKEGIYIRRYMPCLNYQIPKVNNWRSYTVQKSAKTITFTEWLLAFDK